MTDRHRPRQEGPEGAVEAATDSDAGGAADTPDLGDYRGVVLDATDPVDIVSEPPTEPAQPPTPRASGATETR